MRWALRAGKVAAKPRTLSETTTGQGGTKSQNGYRVAGELGTERVRQ